MKKTGDIISFIIITLIVAIGYGITIKSGISESYPKILAIILWVFVVGMMIFKQVEGIKRHNRGEPIKDELTKKIRTRASSYAFNISLFLWLIISLFIEKLKIAPQMILIYGIFGMLLIFSACWLFSKYYMTKYD
jgi:hypothetical protein